jgi:hypothetical protein
MDIRRLGVVEMVFGLGRFKQRSEGISRKYDEKFMIPFFKRSTPCLAISKTKKRIIRR